MKPNTFRRLAMFAVALAIVSASASTAAAQTLWVRLPVITLPGPNDLVEIKAGDYHTCVRKYNGNVYCWGLNSNSTDTTNPNKEVGQVGVASTKYCIDSIVGSSPGASPQRRCVDTPQFVQASASNITAGSLHTCSIVNQVAYCWGSDSLYNQLGDSGSTDRVMPQPVSGNHQFSSVSAGPYTTCGLSSIEGVLCWGLQIFDIHLVDGSKPTLLETYYGSGYSTTLFNNFAVGYGFGCGVYITGSYGENDCRGIDNFGQIGVDPTASWLPKTISNVPYSPAFVGSGMGYGSDGQPHVKRASAGANYMCADIMDGTVQCVGANSAGQLGNAAVTGNSWKPVTVASSTGAMQLHGVTTGFDHACALDAANHAWCWGSGEYGQLGNAVTGSGYRATSPQPVSGTVAFRALAAGFRHTCGIGTDNYVYCWGDNEYGQLGVGLNTLGFWPSGFGYATYTGTPRQVAAF